MALVYWLFGTLKYLLVFVVSVLVVLYFFVSKDYNYWKKRGVRYVKPRWMFGNMDFLMRKSVWSFFYDLWQNNPVDYVGIFLLHRPVLIVQSPEIAKRIYTEDADVFEDRYIYSGASDPIGAYNLFSVQNPIWSELRCELSPMFTPARLRLLTDTMNYNAKELVARIDREHIHKNKPVHLKDLFSRYTSDTVAYTVFGIRTSALSDDSNPLWQITTHMVQATFWRGFEFTITLLVPAVAQIMRLKMFSEEATEYIRKLFDAVVKEREETKKHADKDLVKLLLNMKKNIKSIPEGAGEEFLDDLLLAQAAVFVLGSVANSSSTITYLLEELAYHPEEQEKLYNAIDEAHKRTGKEILDFNDLLEVHYLNSCIQETLRKYTMFPYTDRVCKRDYKIDDQLTIEKGTPVLVSLVGIHRDPRNYPEPSRWRPERFTGLNSDNDNRNFTYLPFGEGPRYCIGKRYGMIQIRAALAQVVHKYRIEPATDAPYEEEVFPDPYSVISKPKNGGSVKFVPRT